MGAAGTEKMMQLIFSFLCTFYSILQFLFLLGR